MPYDQLPLSLRLYQLNGTLGKKRFKISTYKEEKQQHAYMIYEYHYKPTSVRVLLALRNIPVVNEKCKYKV